MGAAPDNTPVFQDEDLVGIADGGDALGDDQRGAVCRGRGECGTQPGVGRDVEGREGVVEDVDGRLLDQGPGDRQTLPLTARYVRTALCDARLQAAFELRDEVRGLGDAQRLPHLLVGGVGTAVSQVGGHGAGEQVGLLRHQPDARPQGIGVELPHVDAVHQHLAAGRVEQPGDQVHQGGLSRARRADDRGRAAGVQREGEVRQCRGVGTRVGEGDVTELDDPRRLLRGDGIGRRSDRGLGVQHLQDPVRRHGGARGEGQ